MHIERAILSVSDKTGIVELARALMGRGVEILSTGGTAAHLESAGVAVTPISKWSGAPEILGGRVKTLTPKVFGAILHDRDNQEHVSDIERLSIPGIDLVVVNLYPFEATVAKQGVTVAEAVEQIDIGGPSMLRAAAKNHRHVLPLCDPSLYGEFVNRLEEGTISSDFRLKCAIRVFEKTSAYDAAIAAFLGRSGRFTLSLEKFQDLRYGENPHQAAGFYVESGKEPFEQVHGKELSYNNLLDLDAAIRLAHAFDTPSAAIIKHTNPCGAARGETPADALRLALESDPVSAFGGIVGVNREFDGDCARVVAEVFLEVIVAPSFSAEALEILIRKKNLRLITAAGTIAERELRSAAGGILVQTSDRVAGRESWKVVSQRLPSDGELEGLEFAWIVCAHVKSNAIVLTNRSQSIGIGAGQMSRVDSAKVAIMKSTLSAFGSVAASDAFFPFRDGLDLLANAGIIAVIQPGGSVRDAELIAAADEHNMVMVFTGQRHFRH